MLIIRSTNKTIKYIGMYDFTRTISLNGSSNKNGKILSTNTALGCCFKKRDADGVQTRWSAVATSNNKYVSNNTATTQAIPTLHMPKDECGYKETSSDPRLNKLVLPLVNALHGSDVVHFTNVERSKTNDKIIGAAALLSGVQHVLVDIPTPSILENKKQSTTTPHPLVRGAILKYDHDHQDWIRDDDSKWDIFSI